MSRDFTILDAIDDQLLFARWFKDRDSWQPWFAFLSALFALPLSPEQLDIYRTLHRPRRATDRAAPRGLAGVRAPRRQELHARSGRGVPRVLPGLRRSSPPASAARSSSSPSIARQARTIMRYIRALLTRVPMLSARSRARDRDTFDLKNGVTIEIGTASFRSRARLHPDRGAAGRAGVLSGRRGRRRARLRDHQRDPPRHGDDPELAAAVRQFSLCAARRLVGRPPPPLRPATATRSWCGRPRRAP